MECRCTNGDHRDFTIALVKCEVCGEFVLRMFSARMEVLEQKYHPLEISVSLSSSEKKVYENDSETISKMNVQDEP